MSATEAIVFSSGHVYLCCSNGWRIAVERHQLPRIRAAGIPVRHRP